MRLSIDHRTTYRFTEPQARVVQLLRLSPRNTHDQTVADWHISLDCDARLTEHRDGFGNLTHMLYAEGPIDRVEIAVSGEVVTSHSDGVLHGTFEPLPPRLYLRTTALTGAGEAVRALAATLDAADPIAGLHRLNQAIHGGFALDRGRPEPGVTAEMTAARQRGTARDIAHVFIAAARVGGVPARYVTGYSDLQASHRPTPHGWAEAWVDGLGWIGFDPTLGASPEEHHVRVAVALDAVGCAPVAGTRLGEGEEELDVDVTVSPAQ